MKTLKVLLVAAMLISVAILAGCQEACAREDPCARDDRQVIRKEIYMLRGDGLRIANYAYLRQ